MPTHTLLAYICGALLVQLAVGIAIGLSRRQRRAPAGASVAIDNPSRSGRGAWSGWRDFRVERRELEDRGCTQCSFYLRPLDGRPLPPFEPGQFLTLALSVPGHRGDTETITRCYSLSDQPNPAHYRITVKRVSAPAAHPELPNGVASNHLHDRIHVGDVLRVKAPAGHFHLDPDPSVPAVFVAGGIGITPLLCMLQWCRAEQPQRTLHLYYGVRNGREHAFKETLDRVRSSHPQFHLTMVYSRPDVDDIAGRDFHHVGHLDVDLLRRSLPHGRHQFYVCGPAPMMESIIVALRAWGVPDDDIQHEAFGPASVRSLRASPNPPAAADAGFEIQFQRARRTLTWDGHDANLLEFAEAHAIEVESGCRSGSCGSCETRLISGTVRYATAPDHDLTPGTCLLCVGTPASPLVLDA